MTVTISDNGDLLYSSIFEVPQRACNSLHTCFQLMPVHILRFIASHVPEEF